MKLDKKIKEQIDRYFSNISAEELYHILTDKYKFPKCADNENYQFIYESTSYINKKSSIIYEEYVNYTASYNIKQLFNTKEIIHLDKNNFNWKDSSTPLAA